MRSEFDLLPRLSFWVKSRGLMARQSLVNLSRPKMSRAPLPDNWQAPEQLLARHKSPLFNPVPPEEQSLQLGKVQNLRIVARMLDGVSVGQDAIFSFWELVNRPTRRNGFVEGRELRQGCIIPTVAGGICQISNALSSVASEAGMEIVERHRHSAKIDGLDLDENSDATLFWNYLDFRFRARVPVALSVNLTSDALVVALYRLP